jgi:hypothetical protein
VKCTVEKEATRNLTALYSRDFFDIRRKYADGREKCGACSWAHLRLSPIIFPEILIEMRNSLHFSIAHENQ